MGKAFIHINNNSHEDCYQTPYSMTEQFLEREHFDFKNGSFLEPACGYHAISNVLVKHKIQELTSFDIHSGIDFLKYEKHHDHIITNPPYKYADEFVLHAKKLYKNRIAFLLRINYLSGEGRYNLDVYDELKTIYVFTKMPDLRAPIRLDGKYPTAGIVYAWHVWEKGYKGDHVVKHISNQQYCLKKCEYDLKYTKELIRRGIINKNKEIPKQFRSELELL